MNIGGLYFFPQNQQAGSDLCWYFYSTKQVAKHIFAIYDGTYSVDYGNQTVVENAIRTYNRCWNVMNFTKKKKPTTESVTFLNPEETHFVLLEEDGFYKKILTGDGKIGWIILKEELDELKTP